MAFGKVQKFIVFDYINNLVNTLVAHIYLRRSETFVTTYRSTYQEGGYRA